MLKNPFLPLLLCLPLCLKSKLKWDTQKLTDFSDGLEETMINFDINEAEGKFQLKCCKTTKQKFWLVLHVIYCKLKRKEKPLSIVFSTRILTKRLWNPTEGHKPFHLQILSGLHSKLTGPTSHSRGQQEFLNLSPGKSQQTSNHSIR